jgi:hypothetical protein
VGGSFPPAHLHLALVIGLAPRQISGRAHNSFCKGLSG